MSQPPPEQSPQGQVPPPPPSAPSAPSGYPPPPAGQPHPGWAPPPGQPWGPSPGQQWGGQPWPGQPYGAAPGAAPGAPWGVHPVTGVPYSEKSKLVAGLLQLLIPLGLGRFYIGDTTTGVLQLVVTVLTCGIGAIWPFVDGIILLATDSRDAQGHPLRS
ncbi:TM2 domain-containing protein [Nocardioides sp. TRM66260-LWL]|uniref:NINE protein n=1 Tax=Nocardioides sp. TRM66260-LWL TaxID=2874478 RepID=UPI001CC51858|nr:TM2 domain-containing protein [Nocardioides sp. TRM66260-LWL]MBZ5735865.1 TM2 domain-containing protein [Nocardioides sp. TRM66260-LWL]